MEAPLVLPANDATVLIGVAVLLPGLVTILTKTHAPDWVKNVMNLVLAALVAVIDQVFRGDGNFTWSQFGASWALTFAASVLAYSKLWKDSPIHSGVAALTNKVGLSAKYAEPVNNPPKPVELAVPVDVPLVPGEPVRVPVTNDPVAGAPVAVDVPASASAAPAPAPTVRAEREARSQPVAGQPGLVQVGPNSPQPPGVL